MATSPAPPAGHPRQIQTEPNATANKNNNQARGEGWKTTRKEEEAGEMIKTQLKEKKKKKKKD